MTNAFNVTPRIRCVRCAEISLETILEHTDATAELEECRDGSWSAAVYHNGVRLARTYGTTYKAALSALCECLRPPPPYSPGTRIVP